MSGAGTIGAWFLLLACGWLAGTISGAAGFGGALILLPVLAFAVGGKAAVPMLTVAQLLGNLSRAGFGRREIRWRPAGLFCLGAVPASVAGARLFVGLESAVVLRFVGGLLLLVVALRHTRLGRRKLPVGLLVPVGAVVGLVSAVAGSAGPLGAAAFLGLGLPPQGYVASEAATAVAMHATKSLVYGRYGALTLEDGLRGLLLGGSLVLGSWTGRKVLDRLPERWFGILVEVLLLVSAVALLRG
ncbi:Sulfite exporter TauE/SafE [Aquisphaera giovannonii]|uniref:Probable membrane transporter protein n=1 Tax=Aquisphaera giovannonii TaxID=406548 RepID=A0A5B9WEB4_9BACT|nr:sulfite exporter TauE/SafE family protein [Aquisphaera giovannonii]QEH38996.1 Sulfite exporter TauE/SafE [Aquisphaera giovannonii]